MEHSASTELQTSPSSPRAARAGVDVIPSSPPPSYEHVLAETRSAAKAAVASERVGTPLEESTSLSRQSSTSTPTTTTPTTAVAVKRQEILHKSSKELYRAVAAQWGITCKMSDQCRCLDCQSNYFECEYDQNEDEKTDGGLGAGTPMFISEVMAGTACAIL